MKYILKETIKIIAILAIAIPAFAFLAGSWNEPIQSPPGTNVDAPINVGLTAQTKEGGLWLNTGGASMGLIMEGGLRVGSTSDTNAGNIRWTGLDLEIYMGGNWISLTGAALTPTCTDFTYSAWGACQPGDTQTRSITSYIPAGCTGGAIPITTQSCTYVPPMSTQCANAGGNWVDAQGVCYFPNSSCSNGWHQEQSYSSTAGTSSTTCPASDGSGVATCTVPAHFRQNIGNTSTYVFNYSSNKIPGGTCYAMYLYGTNNTCTASLTEIGCTKN